MTLKAVSIPALGPAATAAAGQIPGTATNDNAAAGNVGEYRSASNADTGQNQASATVTITIASPAVVTWGTTTPFVFNGNGTACINFTTTNTLPTGIIAGTTYYVIGSSVSGNTFQIATTADNAIAGTAINTSGSQAGVHTGIPTVPLISGSTFTVAAMSLTAGDWDVSADLAFFGGAATSITILTIGISTAAGAFTGTIPSRLFQTDLAANVPGTSNSVYHAGPARFSLAATTTIYGVVNGSFTISTLAGWGGMHARRVR